MKAGFSKQFEKQYTKLRPRTKLRFQQQLDIFMSDSYDNRLSNHPLRGKYTGYRSINITGDYRAVYKMANQSTVRFVAIGTHSQLYR